MDCLRLLFGGTGSSTHGIKRKIKGEDKMDNEISTGAGKATHYGRDGHYSIARN
jgi:hypothetical protein